MLEVRDVRKGYEGQAVLERVSFVVEKGETVCLLGESGSGKSTLLRLIAGLEAPDSGQILWNGADLASMAPHLRNFGLVFQDYALFPHLNVFENVAFGLRMRKLSYREVAERVASSLKLVNLEGFDTRDVSELSGGEQQRVALARALAPEPRLLMFDEPLGALDRVLRDELLNELRLILHRTEIPSLYITHDQEEAFAIADRILILHEGVIMREGSPAELWASPGSAWLARFLGLGIVIQGRVDSAGRVATELGELAIDCLHGHTSGETIGLLLRPASTDSGEESIEIRGQVMDVIFQQGKFKAFLDNGFSIDLPKAPRLGERISARVKLECLE